MTEKRKKITSIDLDGVLNTYRGNKDFNPRIISPIREDTYDFLEKLNEIRDIEIYTVRDLRLVNKWAREYGIAHLISNTTHIKNKFASEFVDDRAVYFDGNYENCYNSIVNLKPHWKE